MAKSFEKLEARKLRKKGTSIRDIAARLSISKSSASIWCQDIELTPEQTVILIKNAHDKGMKGRLMGAKMQRDERIQRESNYKTIGIRKVGFLNKRELFLVGSALYWAEGSKKSNQLVFTNSDPVMITLFMRWITECLEVDRGRLYCRLMVNQEHGYRVKNIERYWSNLTGISLNKFRRTLLRKAKSVKIYENPELYYGTLHMRVQRSTNLLYEIRGYIHGLGGVAQR